MIPDNRSNFPAIWEILKKEYPNPQAALHFSNPLELLIATILSAQCTDAQVNMVTEKLFKKYRTVEDFANADQEALEKEIYSTGFYRNKAKHIRESAQIIITEFGGEVPDNMEDLLTLPGVARKTANIVLARGFGIIDGVAVDTHVKRLSGRLGLSKNKDPVKIEKDLMQLTDREEWDDLSMTFILHGRNVCDARKPKCGICKISELCPSSLV
ncbi:endonuclease III [Methanohalophilus sp.]|uniref:endonuclease III n=1 Tax=Methanohalophilus sp. TaxID=1966352 RepID=UPI002634573B|nr:endonuclease III [Methanohalophilus sp.]MDK2892247.1 endonuclease [Methanohalophilus sp.]